MVLKEISCENLNGLKMVHPTFRNKFQKHNPYKLNFIISVSLAFLCNSHVSSVRWYIVEFEVYFSGAKL
jgi:hypothetical protein